MSSRAIMLLFVVVLSQTSILLAQNAEVFFLQTAISIGEVDDASFTLNVQKTGNSDAGFTIVVAPREGGIDNDFNVPYTQIIEFSAGDGVETEETTWYIKNDDMPEGDEIFTFELRDLSNEGQAIVVSEVVATVTILANDDAYGILGFSSVEPLIVTEDPFEETAVEISCSRQRGSFSLVSATYEIIGIHPDSSDPDDLYPTTGSVVFQDGQNDSTLSLRIVRDQIPENDETFEIRLLEATDGAKLLETASTLTVIILKNDSPLRFSQAFYLFEEDVGTASIDVHRGLAADGVTLLGPDDETVTVEYFIVSSSGTLGLDALASNGTLTFLPSEYTKTITITILPDDIPEIGETLDIILANPSSNAVVTEPYVTALTILGNDDQHGVLSLRVSSSYVTTGEDTSLDFVVDRFGGTFGNVTVNYEIVRNDSNTDVVIDDLFPSEGTIHFSEGQASSVISINVIDDSIPEEAERYIVRIVPSSVTGGARVSGTTEGQLLIADSDDAYGVIQFSSETDQSIASSEAPRKLKLTLARGAGVLGAVLVNFTVTYDLPAGDLSTIGTEDVLDLAPEPTTVFPQDLSIHRFSINIRNDAFLSVGAVFKVIIHEVMLQNYDTILPPYSPRIGENDVVSLEVSAAEANGDVGFDQASLTLEVQEPEEDTLQVRLNVTREGTSGYVSLLWRVSEVGMNSSVRIYDLSPSSGTVYMPPGVARGYINIQINSDDIAELEEVYQVELYSINPDNQRLKDGYVTAQITLLENDDPGGVFEFASYSSGPFVTTEAFQVIRVSIIRTGSTLATRQVKYSMIDSSGESNILDFFNVPNFVEFGPGETIKNVSFIAKDDDVPELDDVFNFTLESYGLPPSDLGPRTSIMVTILENDDPYGVFQFEQTPTIIYIDESKGTPLEVARYPVVRVRGSFETVTVSWTVSPLMSPIDVTPVNGTLTFIADQTLAYIEISSQDDQIPEASEQFTITLHDATGGSKIGTNAVAYLNINKNDDAIFFEDPAEVDAEEPSTILLTVRRNGTGTDVVSVDYRTVSVTAQDERQDYEAASGTLTFSVGVKVQTIELTILQDDNPEEAEIFIIELFNPIGDVVVYGTPVATVSIVPNDDASGIFSFSQPLLQTAQSEGVTVDFFIQRDRGYYGVVQVYWRIVDNGTLDLVADGQEFENVEGVLEFADRQSQQVLSINVLADFIPEFTEYYEVQIVNVSGGYPNDLPTLSETGPLSVLITILPNDDPYGVLRFSADSRERDVAEDHYPGDVEITNTNFTVVRDQGLFSNVGALWEVFTDSISGGLPSVTDLLFLAEYVPGAGVTSVPDQRRPHTGTNVFSFSGGTDSYLSVPAEYHPPPAKISSGFSISAWVKPTSDCNGFIISKVSATDNIKMLYGLKLEIQSSTSIYMEFRYSTDVNVNLSSGTTFSGLLLTDGQWHQIIAVIGDLQVQLFVDGQLEADLILSQQNTDSDGMMYVGARLPSSDTYKGLLQDVRLYSRRLTMNEISEIWNNPATKDVTPISGYVTFDTDESMQQINIAAIQDTEEEGNEVFTVILLTVNGGARLDSDDNSAVLTVLKSDNANGLFGFSGLCYDSTSDPLSSESVTYTCPVVRTRGDEGIVSIPWKIQNLLTGVVAETDFVNASGVLVFANGIREMEISIVAVEDLVPELAEDFTVELISSPPMSDDGIVGSTDTSGASIDPANAKNNITIALNDFPYGLLQFAVGSPPVAGDPLVPPEEDIVRVSVEEDAGFIQLLVVRALGLLGPVTVEWSTLDGTAVSAGKDPIDFVGAGGTLTFGDEQRHAYINITIIDNNIPELEKAFRVQLSNPTGGADLDIGSTVEVTILNSDEAYGLFEFAENSLDVTVGEMETAALQVIRTGGALGVSTVYWQVTSNPLTPASNTTTDLLQYEGYVTFDIEERAANIEIQPIIDQVPELDEMFFVNLISVSDGGLGASLVAQLTIRASDDPYGMFNFDQDSLRIVQIEADQNISLNIIREAGSVGSVQVFYSTLRDDEELPNMPPFTSRASEDMDFEASQGSLIFTDGQREATVMVKILDDDQPETEETLFIYITRVTLTDSPQATPVIDSPSIGEQSVAEVVIPANDNANGILQLTLSEITISEDFSGPFINITRTAGSFGQISVGFETIPDSAQRGLDYSITSSNVVFLEGETTKALPVEILNDPVPEIEEQFEIILLDEITGGAALGSPSRCVVVITQSDDPNGNFGFGQSHIEVNEPDGEDVRELTISVIRSAGDIGVVPVTWEATINGVLAVDDVFPTGGTLFFLTTKTTETFKINILADDIPEENEDIILTLVGANGGGSIGSQSTAVISISANDNPHGTVEFSSAVNPVLEDIFGNNVANIEIIRSDGLFGELEIIYSSEPLDIVDETYRTGLEPTDFYHAPIQGSQMGVSKTVLDVSMASSPLGMCVEYCLRERACAALEFKEANATVSCLWSVVADGDNIDSGSGFTLYIKDVSKAQLLYDSVAQPGVDYSPVMSQIVRIPDGASTGTVTVVILDDAIPEMAESFKLKLDSVQLVGSTPTALNEPSLGVQSKTRVVIETNDDANGVWRIYSNNPDATNNGQMILVEERNGISVGVELTIERMGGTIGDVGVSWQASGGSADIGDDYIASGGTLSFASGEIRRVISISIKDDNIPEVDETITIELYDPEGGSVLGTDPFVSIIIASNDFVAGTLKFADLSYIVKEGEDFNVTIERSLPAVGLVSVDWQIQGTGELDPSQSFRDIAGKVSFGQGQLAQVISLYALSDETPEVNEEFVVILSGVETEGVSSTGAAELDPQGSEASITISASDEPHGVFSFAQGSDAITVSEDQETLQLFVNRKFGNIGSVRVYYEVLEGSLTLIPLPSLNQAIRDEDFVGETGFVDFVDGVSDVAIIVQIIQDEIPELDEQFLVNLTSIQLLDPATSDTPPALDEVGTLAEVTIRANDGTQGVIKFDDESASILVEEGITNITLTVIRDKGTYGDVTVFIYSQPLESTRGSDYSFSDMVLSFASGEDTKTVTVQIFEDTTPEDNESFEIILGNPYGGLEIGEPSKAVITILSNDDAYGIVSFTGPTSITILEPTDTSSANSVAQFAVIREQGTFGEIQVPFQVLQLDGQSAINDLNPATGFVIFSPGISTTVLHVSAVLDNDPELQEEFIVILMPPTGGAILGPVVNASIIVADNDSPYGLLQIYPQGSRSSIVDIEETGQPTYLTVERSFGTLNQITVDWQTIPGTAVASVGTSLTLAASQSIIAMATQAWYSFTIESEVFLVLTSSRRLEELTTIVGSNGSSGAPDATPVMDSMIYRWQGVFVAVQTIETNSARKCSSHVIDGITYLVVANHGGFRKVQTSSRLYRVESNGELLVVQDILTEGASDAVFFTSGSNTYLFITNEINNSQATRINSVLLIWNGVIFTEHQQVPTSGALDVVAFQIGVDQFVAVANSYDQVLGTTQIQSSVFRLQSGQLVEYQSIDSNGAVSVESFVIGSSTYLVIANSRSSDGSSEVKSIIYKWNIANAQFAQHQSISTPGVQSIKHYTGLDGTAHLVVAQLEGESTIWAWNSFAQSFTRLADAPMSHDLEPVLISGSVGSVDLYIASANYGDGSSPLESFIYEAVSVSADSDFVPRSGQLTFEDGQTELTLAVVANDDADPENDESFSVGLSNPTGGAIVGAQGQVTVNILSNDDAHGLIAFTQDSLNKQVSELNVDNVVVLNVERRRGSAGLVVIEWQASGDNDVNDTLPQSGQIEFPDGVSTAAIVITIKADSLPELDETVFVSLVRVVNPGTPHTDRGAVISSTDYTARMVILANDSPHGVFTWSFGSLFTSVSEPEGQTSFTIGLQVVREQGLQGTVLVRYSTFEAIGLPVAQQAESDRDYVSRVGYVTMGDGISSDSVTITILSDTDAEGPETFFVNLTSVELLTGSPISGAPPSVKNDQNVAEVVISQNDNANGILQFDVTRNSVNEVEVYEGSGTSSILSLPVLRSGGAFDIVGVSWLAFSASATTADYSPVSGNITFAEGQREAVIDISIIDDNVYETDESFTVQLNNPRGGAVLGSDTFATIKILKNDSPKGLFGFTNTQATVAESTSNTDANGLITITVERAQGQEGEVDLVWELEESGIDDITPSSGTLSFPDGATSQSFTLRAVVDNILEGEERFMVAITSVTDDAEISPVNGVVTIIIQANAGSAGLVSVQSQSRQVLIGEPESGYDGSAVVGLTRGSGVFGEIVINWQLDPRDTSVFAQAFGSVVFNDGQSDANILLQTLDDATPELKQVYTLRLSSVVGGATIDDSANADRASITVVASDNPHGVVEFSGQQEVVVSEDSLQLTLEVVRNAGSIGLVRVIYTTIQGTASEIQDFNPKSGFLTFNDGVDTQSIVINLQADDVPEGPENFYVNLTSIQLISPSGNDYSNQDGLQLDMPPILGDLTVKTVTIEKNDNAEGVIEFAPEALVFVVQESEGSAMVPVIRTRGTFGIVSVGFTSVGGTAIPNGVDYILTDGEAIFLDGESTTYINVNIIDDQIKEFAESFEIMLTQVEGGATLGEYLTATVTIAKSDGPDGFIEFVPSDLSRIIPNPSLNREMVFTVELSGGIDQYLTGTEVKWRILGPNSDSVLQQTNDISTSTGQLQGSLSFAPGERAAKSFTLVVKPYPGPEVEETYIIEVYQVVGAGEVKEDSSRAQLKILKFGDPNGIVQFYADSLQTRTFSEPADASGSSRVVFPIRRREGTIGDVLVNWDVRNAVGDISPDVEPSSGSVEILDGVAASQITINILADQTPELREELNVILVSVEGGAEIDPDFNVSTFFIDPSDDPHGLFSIEDDLQSVSMRADGSRFLSIVVTRSAGTEGQVRVDFTLAYDQAEPGIEYIRDTATVVCSNGQSECTAEIPLVSNNVFLARDTSFTVTLTTVAYVGVPYIAPVIKPGAGSATVLVTQEVANSLVGFDPSATNVNEETYQTLLTIERIGSYGSMSIYWTAGYPPGQLPAGFTPGSITPSSGQVLFDDGQTLETISIRLNPTNLATELFAVFLNVIDTSVDGGARLRDGYITAEIDKHGVVGFAADSQSISVTEVNGQISLTLERSLGTFNNILVRYITYALTAVPGEDYQQIVDGAVTMGNMERTAKIFITLLEEENPELPEVFFVNITSTRIASASAPGLSPRISSLNPVAEVTIEASNDPYGVFYLMPESVVTTESIDGSFKLVTLKAIRAGGSFTEERITVRTVGGGEIWEDALIGPPTDTINTISDALANAKMYVNSATQGSDYEVFEEELIFFEGETEETFQVKLFDDNLAEPSEVFFVYLVPPSTGARIAEGDADGGKQGFTQITIAGSDDHNGEIGFASGSIQTTVDEDLAPSVILYLNRGSAFFDNVTVNWRAITSLQATTDATLRDQLLSTEGQIICIAGQAQCELPISLEDDDEPEFSSSFLVELLSVGQGAVIQETARYANITMLESDYPYGLFKFSTETRIQSTYYKSNIVGLTVIREGGSTKEVTVSWSTRQLIDSLEWAGVQTQPAIEDADYLPDEGVITFAVGQRSASIDIIILSSTPASSDRWPKLFQVVLSSPTGGASVDDDERTAYITLVEDEDTNDVWDTWKQALTDLSDDGIYRILQSIMNQIRNELTEEQLTVTMETLNNIIGEGQRRLLPANLQQDMMDVYCELMDPDRSDTRGAYGLAESLTLFAYTLLTDSSCETVEPKILDSCPLAYVQVARWLPDRINGHSFNGRGKNTFALPSNLLIEDNSAGRGDVETTPCEDIHFIEYSSQQWFYELTEPTTVNQQVLSVGMKGREDDFSNLVDPVKYRVYTEDARVTPLGAECVIFNGPSERWLSTFCEARKVETGYVECECDHLSEFAVLAETDDLVGYNVYIYISCFITIICLLMALLAHHVCSVHTMFAAKLLMHLIFAVMATEIMFVISAYISNDVSSQSCSALSAILHYFFLAQFIWMLVQSINLWKILVLNDEHTDRFYVLFFVLGWGAPAVAVVTYIVITYSIFEWPFHQESLLINLTNPEVIYGDVHGNGDICFMPNVNAMLASVAGPVVICIMAVVTIFIQAYLVKPQWKRYDDVYMGSYNTTASPGGHVSESIAKTPVRCKTKVRLLLIFWTLLIITWLFGGLHMYYSKKWMLILLALFNLLMGLFVFLIYTILRNQLCRPSKGNYSPNYVFDNTVMLLENNQFDRAAAAMNIDKGSRRPSLSKADQARLAMLASEDMRPSSSISQISQPPPPQKLEWDVQSVGHQSHQSVRSHRSQRSQRPSIQNGNMYAPAPFNQNPAPPPVEPNPTPSFHQNPVFPPEIDDKDETDSQDFDDLIFALKTGGAYSPPQDDAYTEQRSTSRLSDWHNVSRDSTSRNEQNDPDDPYGFQRISIADTHL